MVHGVLTLGGIFVILLPIPAVIVGTIKQLGDCMKYSLSISRDCGHIMRGMAIMAIALHNFCHLVPGTVRENESDFHSENIARLAETDCGSWQGVFDIVSFFGWYGVPIFIFLTGYGLVMKYERGAAAFVPRKFLTANWLKLVNLMIPGIVALIATTVVRSLLAGHLGVSWSLRYIFQLTMIPDLIYPWCPPIPGVYWYFGLALQFYVIYALAVHGRPAWWMFALTAATLALQWSVDPASTTLEWIRHNFTGWMTVLVMGILWGRSASVGRLTAICVAAVTLLIFMPSMLNPYTWQLSILAAVIIAFILARSSLHIPLWREMWIWFGKMSPFIFAAHPLVRFWVFAGIGSPVPSFRLIALYLAGVILTAIAYRSAWRYTSRLVAARFPVTCS